MTNIKAIIARIEALLAEGTAQSATYAALECRLAIEKICYDRLKVAHGYIAHEDLRRWQPRDVVQTLIAQVDGRIASPFTLFISPTPIDSSAPPQTKEEYEKIDDWVEVGKQSGFDPKGLGNLWQSLSGLALHVRLPKAKDDVIPDYGDEQAIKKKVEETLAELRNVAAGSLMSSGFGEEVTFNCTCGRVNKRRAALLKDGQTVNCVGADCSESFSVVRDRDEISFARRIFAIKCECDEITNVPKRMLEKMKTDQELTIACSCGGRRRLKWRLGQTPVTYPLAEE